MQVHRIIGLVLIMGGMFAATAAKAENIIVKRQMVGCADEASWTAMQQHEWDKNQQGVSQLIAGGQCLVIDAGETVAILRPGVLTATIGYRGKKLYARADQLRR